MTRTTTTTLSPAPRPAAATSGVSAVSPASKPPAAASTSVADGGPSSPTRWTLALPGGRSLELAAGRPRVMGVLNLTPDSFSDGGRWFDPADASRAVERGLALLAAGAELLDLGAESTRPGGGVYGGGAREVAAEEELARLLPVLAGLRAATGAPLSVDTRKAAVARAALAAGADLVNDVSALADPEMGAVVAAAGCPVVLMHSRGELATMQRGIRFRDVVAEVRSELAEAVARAEAAGIARGQIVIDPGIGFGKTAEQNLALLAGLAELTGTTGSAASAPLGLPVLVGASRKSFLGAVTGEPPAGRLAGSLAAAARSAAGGAAILRVHDVAETASFLRVWTAIGEARA
jgi:dihydropteroate synthase